MLIDLRLPLMLMLLISASGQAQQSDSPKSDPAEAGMPTTSLEVPEPPDPVQFQLKELEQNNQLLQQVIRNLIQRIEQLEQRAVSGGDEKNKESDAESETREKVEQQIKEHTDLINSAFEQRLNKQGGMLLGKGQFVYEPGITWAHSSYDTIVVDGYTVYPVLVVGDIVSERVKRNIITNNHALRFGLGQDFQLDLVIPLGYEKRRFFREDGTSDKRRTDGLGDASLALSYQWVKASPDWPDTVVGLNWKSKTGDDPYRLDDSDDIALGNGFHSYGLSMTSMTSNDPIVMFGGLSVTYTEDEKKPVGRVKPGISYGLNMGMALALNFDTSLSFSIQLADSENTKINGQTIKGSDSTTGSFAVGLSTSHGNGHALDIDLSIGLTSDSPDFQLTLSFPFNYSF